MPSFRPAFWPTVTALPFFVVLLGLGIWQLERLQWKEALIAQRAAALAAPPTALPGDLAAARGMEFRPVRVSGEFLNDHELFLGASNDGGTTGFQVITPLRLADGALLLVDRGWIPGDLKDPAKRAAGQLAGPVELEGLVRLPTKGWPDWLDWALPANDCGRNYWFWIDIPAMAKCGGLDRVLPFTIDAGPAPNPGGWPKGGITRTALPNDHLQYAITWFALAGVLIVIFVVYHRKPSNAPEPPP